MMGFEKDCAIIIAKKGFEKLHKVSGRESRLGYVRDQTTFSPANFMPQHANKGALQMPY